MKKKNCRRGQGKKLGKDKRKSAGQKWCEQCNGGVSILPRYFNYANQRPAQRPPLLAPFRYQRPFSFSAKGRLAHVFAVAEGLKTCFRVRKMVRNKFPRKNRVFPRKIAIFTQKNAFFRDFCGTKAFGGCYQRRDIYQRLFLLAPFFHLAPQGAK